MKKLMMLIAALVLCMTAVAEENTAIPVEIAAQRAQNHIQVGLSEAIAKAHAEITALPVEYQTRAEVVRMSDDSYRWVVTVFDLATLTDGWCLELDAATGAVLERCTTNDGFFQDAHDRWTAQKGVQVLWTPPEKMLFDSLYALQPNYGKSVDGDISWEDAATRAATTLGITKGQYDIGYGYLMGGDGYNGVWEICFVENGQLVYVVNVDAVTGDILLIEPDEGGNG